MFNIGQKVKFNMFDGEVCGKGIIVDYEKGVNQYGIKVVESDDLDINEKMVYCEEKELQPAQFKIPMTEKRIEEILTDIILDNANETELEDCEIRTFEEVGLLTMDKGIVIDLPDGACIQLTIQGYKSSGMRMD